LRAIQEVDGNINPVPAIRDFLRQKHVRSGRFSESGLCWNARLPVFKLCHRNNRKRQSRRPEAPQAATRNSNKCAV